MDELADQLGIDRAGVPPSQRAARRRRHGDRPDAGALAPASPHASRRCGRTGSKAQDEIAAFNAERRGAAAARRRRRLHVVRHRQHRRCPTPRRMRVGLAAGRHADALQRRARYRPGLQHDHDPDRRRCARPAGRRSSTLVTGDTDLTADAGKTSASRQTFVSGKAAERAGRDLRQQILRLANAGAGRRAVARRRSAHGARRRRGARARSCRRPAPLMGEGTFDPPTTPLDADGQGMPYATYAFAAQIAERRGRYRARHGEGAAHGGRARCRQGDQPDPGRGPDRRRHRPGPRPGADGGVPPRPHREPARLPDPDHRRRARDRVHPDRGPRAARSVRRQGRRRAGAGADGAGDPRRDPSRHRRARAPRAGAAASPARGDPARREGSHERRADAHRGRSARPASCAAMPARCCAASARAAPAPATATATRTASWCASIRWCCWPSPISRRVAFVDGSEDWDGELVQRRGRVRHRHRRHHDLSRLQAGAVHRLVEARRRRHGHGRDRGHLQLLRRQGEDRHRPPSRPRAGGGARQAARRSATSPRPSTARRCCRWAACTT